MQKTKKTQTAITFSFHHNIIQLLFILFIKLGYFISIKTNIDTN